MKLSRRSVVHGELIGLLCLMALLMTGLSFFQNQKLKTLARKTESHSVSANVAVPAFPGGETVAQPAPENGDEIDALKDKLNELERKLETDNRGFYDDLVTENELEEKKRKQLENFTKSLGGSQYSSLFEKLNLSPDETEKFIDLYVEMMMAMEEDREPDIEPHDPPSQEEKLATKRRTDKLEAEFETKIRELFGDAEYEAYGAYNERSNSRSSVKYFSSTIALGDTLTKRQQEVLVEIFYKEQGRTQSEMIRKGPDEAPQEKPIDEQLEEAAAIHSKIIAEAEEILTTSQLEALEKYFERERISMEQASQIAVGL